MSPGDHIRHTPTHYGYCLPFDVWRLLGSEALGTTCARGFNSLGDQRLLE